jgi:hypothetical protein
MEECIADVIELIVDLIICTDTDSYYTCDVVDDDDDDDSDIIICDTLHASTERSNQQVIVSSTSRRMSTSTAVVEDNSRRINNVDERTALPNNNSMVSSMSSSSSSNPHTVLIHINEQFQPCYDAHSVISNKAAVAGVGADKTSSIASTTKNNVVSSGFKRYLYV